MLKSKPARIAGFIVALGASAALVGAAASSTGAYFTDSHTGNLTAGSGHMTITTSDITPLSFASLNPGQDKTETVTYTASGHNTTASDIWLYFPDTTAYEAFTGAKGNSKYSSGGLGQYGHFEVQAPAGLFNSHNLANDPTAPGGPDSDTSGCAGHNGHGSNPPESGPGANDNGYCGVPRYILLQKNLGAGHTGSAKVTFGLQPTWTKQDSPALATGGVPFKIVATQPGIRPDDAYNGTGQLN